MIEVARRLEDIERALVYPDPERDAWRAARESFVSDAGSIRRVRRIGGGSFLTGMPTETLYSNSTPGTAKATFTTEFAINDTAGAGPFPILPPFFFLPSGSVSRAIRVVARGIVSTTSTAPTWQHFCRFNAGTPAVPPTGPNVGSTPSSAALCVLSMTNCVWEFEEDIQLTVLAAAGASSTLRGIGIFTAQTNNSTLASLSVPILAGNASPGTVATFDISATTFITYSVACGTSNAANSVQLLQLVILGLN